MKLYGPFHRHTVTKFIQVRTGYCDACWKCLDVCPNQVLGKLEMGPHRHIRVDNQENCKGCKKCVKACPHGAIEYVYVSNHQAEAQIS